MGSVWIIAALAAILVCLLGALVSLRASLEEIVRELDGKLNTDTNTLLSVSTADRAVRALAARLNVQLRALRRERLRLRHGDQELKSAVTNIAHDLRTPLTAISGYLELLEQEPQSEKAENYLRVIRERTDAMRALSEELLRYSVSVSEAETLRMETVSVRDVLEQSLAGMYGALSVRGITPEIRLPDEPVYRTLDAAALRRVFDNVLGNAVKYSDGDLTVTLSPEGETVFENGAAALSRVQAERLFERYFTVEAASGSTGLGLSVARHLTEKMGGVIGAVYREERLSIRAVFPADRAG